MPATNQKSGKNEKEEAAKDEIARSPNRDDVHEQREQGQRHPGVMTNVPPRPRPKEPPTRKRT
jgi:hypothetical protein